MAAESSVVTRLVLPLLAVSFALVSRPYLSSFGLKPWTAALAAGAGYGVFAYAVMASRGARAAASRATLMGLVVAQTVLVPRARSLGAAVGFVITVTLLFIHVRNIEQ